MESAALGAAHKWIAQLEQEVLILAKAAAAVDEVVLSKRRFEPLPLEAEGVQVSGPGWSWGCPGRACRGGRRWACSPIKAVAFTGWPRSPRRCVAVTSRHNRAHPLPASKPAAGFSPRARR